MGIEICEVPSTKPASTAGMEKPDRTVSKQDFYGLLERADHASWLNPVIDADTYYIHALAVKPEYRGKRIGFYLIDNAINKAKGSGLRKISARRDV